MATIAAQRVKAWREGLRARERCRECMYAAGYTHDPADHTDAAFMTFRKDAKWQMDNITIVTPIGEVVTRSGWVVMYTDGSAALHSDDGEREEFVRVLRGAALNAVLIQQLAAQERKAG